MRLYFELSPNNEPVPRLKVKQGGQAPPRRWRASWDYQHYLIGELHKWLRRNSTRNLNWNVVSLEVAEEGRTP